MALRHSSEVLRSVLESAYSGLGQDDFGSSRAGLIHAGPRHHIMGHERTPFTFDPMRQGQRHGLRVAREIGKHTA
jgi:hypothetical protein